jgi:chromosome segregation ATPase
MNDVNRISKKISEIQLEAHDVELGAVQDLEKRVQQFENENNQVVELIKTLDAAKSKFKQLDKKIAADFKSLREEAEKLFKQASDLGIETKTPFQLGAKVSTLYGKNWDMDAVSFLRK